jgi:hypothetical protein
MACAICNLCQAAFSLFALRFTPVPEPLPPPLPSSALSFAARKQAAEEAAQHRLLCAQINAAARLYRATNALTLIDRLVRLQSVALDSTSSSLLSLSCLLYK